MPLGSAFLKVDLEVEMTTYIYFMKHTMYTRTMRDLKFEYLPQKLVQHAPSVSGKWLSEPVLRTRSERSRSPDAPAAPGTLTPQTFGYHNISRLCFHSL